VSLESSLLRNYVAAKIQGDARLLVALLRGGTPDALIVLLQIADLRKSGLFDPLFGLGLGEAVAPGNGALGSVEGAVVIGTLVAGGDAAGDVCAKAAPTSEILATAANTATLKRCILDFSILELRAIRML
jgi:hypothetical protein